MMLSQFATTAVLLLCFLSLSNAFVIPTTRTYSTTRLYNKRAKKKGNRSKPQGFAGALRDLQIASFAYAGSVKPGNQSPQKVVVEEGITIPDYAVDGMVRYLLLSFLFVVGSVCVGSSGILWSNVVLCSILVCTVGTVSTVNCLSPLARVINSHTVYSSLLIHIICSPKTSP